MSTTNLLNLSALQLAALIKAGEASSVEVVGEHLKQIERVNPSLHAIVQLSDDAPEDARAADAALASGETPGPLHGVPFTVKDWIETRDLPCAASLEDRRKFRPKRDATAVDRMRAAGAILLGKTKPNSTEDTHPAPKNPYNQDHTPGASSSGEAAIIAARGSPLGLGSDSGGSLRWPAHCCGIATLKPTSGLVPNTGHFPPIIAMSDPRTVIGPMARRVADLAVTLKVVAGEDGKDASTLPFGIGDMENVAVSDLRVACFSEFEGTDADAATLKVFAEAKRALMEGGASVTDDCPPRIEEASRITNAYWSRPESMSLKSWSPWGESNLDADAIERSLFEWDRLKRAFAGFMAGYDVILCPAASSAAPARFEATVRDYMFTLPFSLTGYPVAVVRAGTSGNGLPIGVQIAAKPFRDHIALAAAQVIEQHTGPFVAPDVSGLT